MNIHGVWPCVLLLVSVGCTKSAAQMFDVGEATGDFEYWKHANLIVCSGSPGDGFIGLVGEAEDYNGDDHKDYVLGLTFPWPAAFDTVQETSMSVYVTTVADAASGGSGTIRYRLGPMLPEAVGDEPEETRWHELTIEHMEIPEQTLNGLYGTLLPLWESTLDDGLFYCENLDASLANQLGYTYRY